MPSGRVLSQSGRPNPPRGDQAPHLRFSPELCRRRAGPWPGVQEYFAEDLKLLQTFIDDGLVRMTEEGLEVVSTGQLLIRNICMCFDVYLRSKARQQQFSRVI